MIEMYTLNYTHPSWIDWTSVRIKQSKLLTNVVREIKFSSLPRTELLLAISCTIADSCQHYLHVQVIYCISSTNMNLTSVHGSVVAVAQLYGYFIPLQLSVSMTYETFLLQITFMMAPCLDCYGVYHAVFTCDV